jgi:hypothetical protein
LSKVLGDCYVQARRSRHVFLVNGSHKVGWEFRVHEERKKALGLC